MMLVNGKAVRGTPPVRTRKMTTSDWKRLLRGERRRYPFGFC